MVTLKLAYSDKCTDIFDSLNALCETTGVTFEAYNENTYKGKKKAMGLKARWGTRLTPFVVLTDDLGKDLKAFYSDNNECSYENIKQFIGIR